MTTSTRHKWLSRLSDYHNGGGSDAELAAVEAHLRTCSECQEALAMYRRFYALLRSPLHLGAPSAAISEDTPTMYTRPPTQTAPRGRPPFEQPHPRSRRTLTAGIAAGLAAVIVVAGFLAVLATRGGGPSIAGTPVLHLTATTAPRATETPTAGATPGATTPPVPSAFVCADPAGSQMVYAYVRGDANVYFVKGCTVSGALVPDVAYAHPVAWSPSNRYLFIDEPQTEGGDNVFAIDTTTGQRYPTSFSQYYNPNLAAGSIAHIFIGWLDDNSFLGVNVPITNGLASGQPIGPMTVVKVDLYNGKQVAVTKITWAADFVVRDNGRYLFYSGYQSASEGGAYLHRIDLTTGTDTKLVPLGIAGPGPCQGTPICPWTAPFDVTADGAHFVYHNPGPTSTPSDTKIPKDSPLSYASPDGSGAIKPFGNKIAAGLTTPVLSPDGHYVATAGSTYTGSNFEPPQTGLAQLGSSYQIVNGDFQTWRGDSQAMVLSSSSANTPELYTLATGTATPLEVNSFGYVWGN